MISYANSLGDEMAKKTDLLENYRQRLSAPALHYNCHTVELPDDVAIFGRTKAGMQPVTLKPGKDVVL